MYYSVSTPGSQDSAIGVATSPDLVSWKDHAASSTCSTPRAPAAASTSTAPRRGPSTGSWSAAPRRRRAGSSTAAAPAAGAAAAPSSTSPSSSSTAPAGRACSTTPSKAPYVYHAQDFLHQTQLSRALSLSLSLSVPTDFGMVANQPLRRTVGSLLPLCRHPHWLRRRPEAVRMEPHRLLERLAGRLDGGLHTHESKTLAACFLSPFSHCRQ